MELLINAIRRKDMPTVNRLIEANVDINAEFGGAIQYAAANGYLDGVKVLIKAGADVNTCNDQSLRYAASGGYLDVIKVLLDAGAIYHPEWKNIKDEVRQFIEDNQPLGMKSASKLS